MRPQLALRRPYELLGRHPAHALHEPAGDLAAIDPRVDRLADVHEQVHACDPHLAGEAIDQHFAARGTGGEIEERMTAAGFAVEVDAGRRVEAPLADVDPLSVRAADDHQE